MKALILSTVVTLGLISTTVQARPGLFSLPKKYEQKINEGKAKAKSARGKTTKNECVDFSGNWVGTCTDSDGDSYEETFIIDQFKCRDVTISGIELDIGGSFTQSTTGGENPGTFTHTIYPQWNSGMTGLEFRHSFSSRQLNATAFGRGMGSARFTMVGSQLVSKSDSLFEWEYNGNIEHSSFWEECTLDRKD